MQVMNVARTAARAAGISPSVRGAAVALAQQRSMGTLYDHKEKGEEIIFFKKEDELLLRKLAAQLKGHVASSDTDTHHAHAKEEHDALKAIISKYNMPAADIQALLKWRHSHEF